MRWPSSLLDCRFKFSFLRTTPARKPRTECGCQLVSRTIAAIVTPDDDRNIAITRACFEADAFFSLVPVGGNDRVIGRTSLDAGVRCLAGFLAGFRIGVSFD